MKCRNGFVSNSSSSSFLIYGIKGIDTREFVAAVNLLIERGEIAGETDPVDYYKDAASVLGLEAHDPYYEGELFLGMSWSNVGDDETGRQFKNRIEDAIRLALPAYSDKFGTYAEAWRDG